MNAAPEPDSLPSDATSTSLLDLVRAQDDVAWRCLTELYGPLIYYWCRKSGLAAEDSADVLQEVFRSVMIHIGTFDKSQGRGSFRAWLWSITRNKIRDQFRVRSGKAHAAGGTEAYQRLLALPGHEPRDESDSNEMLKGAMSHRALTIIRSEVKETTWLAFWRSTIDDMAPAAVAAELQISVESVWQAKSRVLRRLRQLLAE